MSDISLLFIWRPGVRQSECQILLHLIMYRSVSVLNIWRITVDSY